MQPHPSLFLAACCALPLACRVPAPEGEHGPAATDPTRSEVRLPAEAGWRANLVVDQEPVGVWTVAVRSVYPQYGCDEIVALDDAGRLSVLWSYSGKWTPVRTVHDGSWLGGLVQADLDPRVEGVELYTGSRNGNLWQVTVHPPTALDCRLVARFPGAEIHTLVGGELDPGLEGPELLVFTQPGAMHLARARTDGQDGFETRLVQELPGRIRDALRLPGAAGEPAEIATVGRHGRVEILRLQGGVPSWSTVHAERMGAGRLALSPSRAGAGPVLYSTWDDGRVLRHSRQPDRSWQSELVYAGPQGPRGCAAGRFDADPEVETLAVFGYSGEVELLTRRSQGWAVETIFRDRDKGHWLAVGELDGRNGTDELVAAGYSGRVVLLARPPGYGRAGVLVAPER